MRAKICAIVASCCLMATFATGAQAATIDHSSRNITQGPVSVQHDKPVHYHGGPVRHHGGPVRHHGHRHHGPVQHHGQRHHGSSHGHVRV